jgi:hypothetical protein
MGRLISGDHRRSYGNPSRGGTQFEHLAAIALAGERHGNIGVER